MKILMFNEYTRLYGGTDRVYDTELGLLKQKGLQVESFIFFNKDFYNASFSTKLCMYQLSCKRSGLINAFQKQINSFEPDIIHFHNIYQLFRSPVWNNIDPGRGRIILHLHNYYPFCLNSLMFRKKCCKECLTFNSWIPGILRGCYQRSYFKSWLVSLNRIHPREWLRNISKVSKIIIPSEYLLRKMIETGIPEKKLKLLPNAVLPQKVCSKGQYVLYLGNIAYFKGVEIICKTAEKLPQIQFIIAGDGPDFRTIQSKYKTLPNLSFTGYVDEIKKENLLKGCRFLYFPTQCMETFGLTIIEANSYGKPVLTSGFGATTELVIEGETGIINSDLNINSQSASVEKLWRLTEVENSYGERCITFSKKYSYGNHIKKLISLYEDIL